jgi:Nucleotide-diphospho-sugar transferase
MAKREFLIVTAYDHRYLKFGKFCVDSVARYASTMPEGLSTKFFGPSGKDVNFYSAGRPPAWGKIAIIDALLSDGWEHVCWIDADAAFVRFDTDIREELTPGKDLYICSGRRVESRPGGLVHVSEQPCTGFVIFRNSEWSRDFLRDWWQRSEFTNHCWWELAAFINLAGIDRQYDHQMQDRGVRELQALVDPNRQSRSDGEMVEHVHQLGWEWNCTDNSARGYRDLQPFVRHYTGGCGTFETRLGLAQSDYFRIFNRTL